MKEWPALKPLFLIVGVTGVLLLIIAGLLSQGWGDLLIPPPEGAAEQLVGALGAHRYTGAMNQLSQALQQTREEDLRALVKAIEESPQQGIQDAHGQEAQEQGDQATAQVKVKFGNNQERVVELPLVRENFVWKVSSLDPLKGLGQ